MTVAATVYLGRGGRKRRVVRGAGPDGRLACRLMGVALFACRERSREGTGVTRCEGKALSSASRALGDIPGKVLMQMPQPPRFCLLHFSEGEASSTISRYS